MGEVIGELLPLALGIAISPVPIIAVILMLLAPRAALTSAGFMIGWVTGIVVATVVVLLIAGMRTSARSPNRLRSLRGSNATPRPADCHLANKRRSLGAR